VRYLVVGLGNIGRKRQALLGDRCVATADPYNSDAQYASPLDCPPRSYEAAILATPNQTKVDLLEWLLDHGKHVLVEKPLLFADRAQAERLGRLAAMRKVTWYTSYNHRYETLIQRLADPLVAERIGALYHARLVYGNGTVANVAGTWRDQGLGVLEDLTSHLLDLAGHLLGARGQTFQPWTLQHHEAASFDHCILGSADGRLVLESSYLSWRNTFSIDIFGSRGSMHLSGLEKWGPSELVVRERVYPSGVPREWVETAPGGADPTWQRDLEHFERHCAAVAPPSIDNDWWITETLLSAVGA
jgi:scyllo-inositol 2-dehydrogenase (NADP+)